MKKQQHTSKRKSAGHSSRKRLLIVGVSGCILASAAGVFAASAGRAMLLQNTPLLQRFKKYAVDSLELVSSVVLDCSPYE
jgi:hypothetical protein